MFGGLGYDAVGSRAVWIPVEDLLGNLDRIDRVFVQGELSFGKSVLGELGIRPDSIEPILDSLRAADYASIRGVGGTSPEDDLKDVVAREK